MGWDKFQPPSQGSAEENEWMNGNNTYLHQGEQNKRKRKEKKPLKPLKILTQQILVIEQNVNYSFLCFTRQGKSIINLNT